MEFVEIRSNCVVRRSEIQAITFERFWNDKGNVAHVMVSGMWLAVKQDETSEHYEGLKHLYEELSGKKVVVFAGQNWRRDPLRLRAGKLQDAEGRYTV